jgi:hypothetical protein
VTAGQTNVITAIALNMHKRNDLNRIVNVVRRSDTMGLMIFDASFIESGNRWDEVRRALEQTDK